MTQPKLWSRDFIIASALNFLLVLVFYLLVVVVGLHAIRDLHATPSQAGLIAGVFIIGVLGGRLLIGQLMDRLGRKRSLLVGLFLAAVANLFYFAAVGVAALIATRFLHGVAVGIAATAIASVVAHLIPISRSGEGIGYFSMSASLATAVGPFIGILMMQHTSFETILTLCCLLNAVCFMVAWLLKIPELTQEEAARPHPRFTFSGLIEPKVVPLCIVILFTTLCYSSVLSFLNVFAQERDLSQAASLFFVVYAITLILSRPVSGRLLDSHGANIIIYPCFVLLAAGLALLGMAQSGAHLLIAACLIGLGFGNILSCSQALAIKMVSRDRLVLATSTYFMFVDAGFGLGPYLLGFLVPYTGYADLYSGLAGLTLLIIVGYFWLYGRRNTRYS